MGNPNFYKHGLWNHPLYAVWKTMNARCYNPNHNSYPNYGGRGISVCKEWRDNPKAFIDWAMINGWERGLQIDRKDNDKGYSSDNCRFVTRSENLRNRRDYSKNKTRSVTISGVTKQAAEWEREYGLPDRIISRRIDIGWTGQRLLSPARKHSHRAQ